MTCNGVEKSSTALTHCFLVNRWIQIKSSLRIILGGASPEEDLVLLASCNHTLIGYGTFGLWAGILAQGEVVVPQSLTLFKGTASEEASREFNWTMLAGH